MPVSLILIRVHILNASSNGNDGPWSTFALRIGNPPQLVKILASTSSPEMWVVGPEGCGAKDPVDCPVDRGQIFNTQTSTSWQHWSNQSMHVLDEDRSLPMAGSGDYGSDTVMLRHNENEEILLPNHTIAQISSKDYFLGMCKIEVARLGFTDMLKGCLVFLPEILARTK